MRAPPLWPNQLTKTRSFQIPSYQGLRVQQMKMGQEGDKNIQSTAMCHSQGPSKAHCPGLNIWEVQISLKRRKWSHMYKSKETNQLTDRLFIALQLLWETQVMTNQVKQIRIRAYVIGLNCASATHKLCDTEEVSYPLSALISSSVIWDNQNTFLKRSSWDLSMIIQVSTGRNHSNNNNNIKYTITQLYGVVLSNLQPPNQ